MIPQDQEVVLLPCPFCGESEGKLTPYDDEYGDMSGYHVVCAFCDAWGPLGDREYAVKYWNTRKEPQ